VAIVVEVPDGTRISIHGFPSDSAFIEAVAAAARAAEPLSDDETDLRQRIEERLRAAYADLEIRVREEIAGLSAGDRVWYAMRDGRVVLPGD
jgi:hypothetical protein